MIPLEIRQDIKYNNAYNVKSAEVYKYKNAINYLYTNFKLMFFPKTNFIKIKICTDKNDAVYH